MHTNTMYFCAFFSAPLYTMANALSFPYSQQLQRTDTKRKILPFKKREDGKMSGTKEEKKARTRTKLETTSASLKMFLKVDLAP